MDESVSIEYKQQCGRQAPESPESSPWRDGSQDLTPTRTVVDCARNLLADYEAHDGIMKALRQSLVIERQRKKLVALSPDTTTRVCLKKGGGGSIESGSDHSTRSGSERCHGRTTVKSSLNVATRAIKRLYHSLVDLRHSLANESPRHTSSVDFGLAKPLNGAKSLFVQVGEPK